MDISLTTAPDSTQINAEDLLAGPVTVTIAGVRAGTPEQPVNIDLAEFPDRAYRPGKSMRRVLVAAWGADSSAYIGRRLTLYRDADVKFGGFATGGIRIQAMSHISKPMTLALTVTRGKRAAYVVQPLADEPAATVPDYAADAQAAQDITEWRQVWQRAKDAGHLNDALKAKLTPIGEALKAEPTPATIPGTDADQ